MSTVETRLPTAVRAFVNGRFASIVSGQNCVADSSAQAHTTITERFGRRLRTLRKDANMTQVELAQHLGIDRSFISDVERAKKNDQP